jgi:hypothetical protein
LAVLVRTVLGGTMVNMADNHLGARAKGHSPCPYSSLPCPCSSHVCARARLNATLSLMIWLPHCSLTPVFAGIIFIGTINLHALPGADHQRSAIINSQIFRFDPECAQERATGRRAQLGCMKNYTKAIIYQSLGALHPLTDFTSETPRVRPPAVGRT